MPATKTPAKLTPADLSAATKAAVAAKLETILNAAAAGETISDAFDAVMGAGAFDKLAGEVWETLRAK